MNKASAAIIDYKMGNIWSLKNALDNINIKYELVSDPEKLTKYSHIVLPGVGSAKEAYERLFNSGFVESIRDAVLNKGKKILGICVGMQLMGMSTEEDGGSNGIGFFENKVLKLKQNEETKLPHVGFNNITTTEHPIFDDLKQRDFYFVHSYAMEIKNTENEIGVTNYSQDFVSVISKENIIGTQFHPEISQKNGLILLHNFFTKC